MNTTQVVQRIVDFPVWKTIKLGVEGQRTLKGLRKAFAANNCSMHADGLSDIYNTIASQLETEVDLVRVSPDDLGLEGFKSKAEIAKRALELGLNYCSLEASASISSLVRRFRIGTVVNPWAFACRARSDRLQLPAMYSSKSLVIMGARSGSCGL